MKASELVGKQVLRSKPVDLGNGRVDWSWSGGRPITLVSCTESHIGIKDFCSEEPHYLDSRWDDGNWVEILPAPIEVTP